MDTPDGALLAELGLPTSAPHEALRALTRTAATVCGVGNAVVNLLGDCFQHQVGEHGFAGGASDRGDSMCDVALREPRLRHVPDARLEPAFATNPWVDGRLADVRLYASCPLVLQDGRVLGSLCVFSDQPGWLDDGQRQALSDLAGQAAALFDLALRTREAERQAKAISLLHAQLAQREDFLAAVLESTSAGIVACDATGRLTLFNRTSRAWHGIPDQAGPDPAQWPRPYELLRPDGQTPLPRQDVPLVRALRDGVVTDAEMVLAPHDGPRRTVLAQGRRLLDGEQIRGAVVVLHDVTGLRERERVLERARDGALASTAAKTRFLAAASHEIRTPLHGVLGSLQLLGRESLGDAPRRHVELATRSAQGLVALLDDLLDLSRAEATQPRLAAEAFDPAELVAEVAAALEPLAARKGLALVASCAPGPRLVGDPARLRQVLVNLLGNALKFTQAGSVVLSADGALRLQVRDTGGGLTDLERGRLFQPFVQGAQGQRYGGSGLGLCLVHQLVELMGGTVAVDSEPGVGSTFTVQVPLVVAATRSGPPRVLVADDSALNRQLAEAVLLAEGAEVVLVCDGAQAVAAVRAGAFDLVLLDHYMPVLDGAAAARQIRQLPGRGGTTRLVAFTGSSGQDLAPLREAGVQDVLVKPVSPDELARALREACA